MNGADAALRTLAANAVTTCFANPGTTEMHLVAAFEGSGVTPVLCLFEGVATGAADGFARVSARPAATLLHLGPGLANGWANLHNARRAHSPIVNLVGDHPTSHLGRHSMLDSDLGGLAASLQGWYRRASRPEDVAALTAQAVAASQEAPGRAATLALAADAMWGEVTPSPWPEAPIGPAASIDADALDECRGALGSRSAILLGGRVERGALLAAWRIARASGTKILIETFPAYVARGLGVPEPERLIYVPEFAAGQLAELEHLILVGVDEPIAAFAYDGLDDHLVPASCRVHSLVRVGHPIEPSLTALAEEIGANERFWTTPAALAPPRGELTAHSMALAVAATLPEGTVIIDGSNTSGIHLGTACATAVPHHWTALTGGSLGYALPAALGAAIATEGRVLALEGDGSMLYSAQALWSMARENLDVTVVALANGRYAILDVERRRLGAADAESERLFDLGRPAMDLAGLARSLGVPARVVESADDLVDALAASYATPGPSFIEARLPSAI